MRKGIVSNVGILAAVALGVGCGQSSHAAAPVRTTPTVHRATTTAVVPGYHPDAAEVTTDCTGIDLADSGNGADVNPKTIGSILDLSVHDLATMRDACESYDLSLEMLQPLNADGTAQDAGNASADDTDTVAESTAASLAGAN